jgi:UDP-glucose 4-epimerase
MIMITGGIGFLGSYICRELVKDGERVLVLDKFREAEIDFLKKIRMPDIGDEVEFVSGDITDFPFVFETLKKYEVQKIIHTAAITFIPTAVKKPSLTFNVNTVGSFNLLEAGRILDIEKFVYISTASIYGDFQYTPADEKHPLNPKDIYGASKAAADRLTASYYSTYKLPTVIVRTSSIYGPGDLEKRVAKNFIENALQALPLELHGGGVQRRDFSYVADVAKGVVLALASQRARGETFNITGGTDHSIKDLAVMVKKFIPKAEIKEVGARAVDVKRGRLDISKAEKTLGYNPEYDLEKGIKDYIRWITKIYAPIFNLEVKNLPVIE